MTGPREHDRLGQQPKRGPEGQAKGSTGVTAKCNGLSLTLQRPSRSTEPGGESTGA